MQFLEEYINYIKDKKKLSENTIISYYTDLKKYIEYLNQHNINIKDLVENDIITYLIKLEKSNTSTATISRTISSIKSFHDYLFLSQKLKNNPANDIKKPKMQKGNINILTEVEIESLLNFSKLDNPKLVRDKAIFEVLYGTGMKVSELIEMNVEDVDLEIDYIYCNLEKNARVIPLSNITKEYLEKYMKHARCELACYDENALFVNSFGKRFTRQGLWKLIKKYANKANIDKNINPTMLRHSFAIHILNKGANIAVVSKILGNSNLSSLQSYLEHLDKNIRKEINEKHPRK